MLLEDADGTTLKIPVNLTPGHYEVDTIDVNFMVCEWLTIKKADLEEYKFIE